MKVSFRLGQAVLASTLFASVSYAGVISTVVNTEQQTVNVGNIEITPTGQINLSGALPANEDGIKVNSASAIVIIDENNNFGNAIVNTRTGGRGINIIAAGGNNANIIIGAGSGIDSASSQAIHIENTGALIFNSGTLEGDLGAIKIAAGGTSATILNAGTMQNSGNSEPTLNVNDVALSFENAGTITGGSAVAAPAIDLKASFTTVTNDAGATINGGAFANALNIGAAATGDIQNSGTITSAAGGVTGAGISVIGAYTGSITNNSGGVISATGAGAGAAILTANTFTNIINASGGTIQATNNNNAIRVETASPNSIINNAGLIQSTNLPAILLEANINQLINTGTIQSTTLGAGGVISAAGAVVTLANGIVNSGNIIDTVGGQAAIDLQSGGGTYNIPLFQNGGTITGDVLLASAGGEVLTMTGGVINGDIYAVPGVANTLQLNGGSITGTVQLGDMGDTVNLGGSALNILNGRAQNDIFNLSGGSFTTLNGGGGGANTINVNGSFSLNGALSNIQTLNINSPAILTVNQAIVPATGITQLNIAAGGMLALNANVSTAGIGSTVTNAGTVSIAANKVLSTDTYTQTGAYVVAIPADDTMMGQIQTTGNLTLNPGSTVYPTIVAGSFIPAGTVYDIAQAPLGLVNDNSTLIQPSSVILFFEKSGAAGAPCALGPGTCIQLTANRNAYNGVALSDNAKAVAATLDGVLPVTTDPDFITLFGQLDGSTSAQALDDALLQLIPPYNYGLVAGSHISVNNAFESVHKRLQELRQLGPLWTEAETAVRRNDDFYNGINYGDEFEMTTPPYGLWFKVLGADIQQKTRNQIEGYDAEAVGFAIGADWGFYQGRVGVAGSYTKTTVDDKSQNATNGIKSYQATFYGQFQPFEYDEALFVDTMFGVASHQYDTTRHIAIGSLFLTPTALFYGLEYAAQADLGYAFLSDEVYYVAPTARVKYSYLDIGNYMETGAGALSLSVQNDNLQELIGGVGFRFVMKRDYVQAVYYPEFSAFVMYDFIGDSQQQVANFLGGGSAFATNGIKPAQLIYLFGVGLDTYSLDNYVFSLKYNLEVRDHFLGHSGYLKLAYRWG